MKEIKNHPYLSRGMEITLPLDEANLPEDMHDTIDDMLCCKEIGEKYGDVFFAVTFLTIIVDAKDISKKRFLLTVFASNEENDNERTKIERELSLSPDEESYFFKEALHRITENYLNIMENMAICSLCVENN